MINRAVLATVAVAFGVAISAIPVLAFDARTGENVTVGSGEKLEGDLYLAGRAVYSAADVDGDVFAAGQTVTVGGQISGGLTMAGQTVFVNGDISRGVRVAGATVNVSGSIGRDLLAGCSTLSLNPGTSVGGDLLVGTGTAELQGDIAGNVSGGCEKLVINCAVRGNVNVKVDTLEIRPGALIQGDLDYTAITEADIPEGAVKGVIRYTEQAARHRGHFDDLSMLGPLAILAGLTWKIVSYLMAFITGLVLIALAPRRMAASSDTIRADTGPVAGYGAIALFVTPIAALVVCLTVIGLPLGIITLLLWGILMYLSQLPVGLLLGHMVLGRQRPLETKGLMIGRLALGLLFLWLLKAIPFLGFFVSLATALFGLGGIVLSEKARLHQ